ncbi:hypothetical protein JTE90_009609 [Oedothorax gibbosus]|uniref:Uncharacterized protein n=1 Tax=Oedothorax gibbosus TaxID=931172 RepID=A0AAV6TYI4_9ARAC|nr:hypothetical protein JTE90_009609 [Oedothorax gibbosus]
MFTEDYPLIPPLSNKLHESINSLKTSPSTEEEDCGNQSCPSPDCASETAAHLFGHNPFAMRRNAITPGAGPGPE